MRPNQVFVIRATLAGPPDIFLIGLLLGSYPKIFKDFLRTMMADAGQARITTFCSY